MAQCTFLGLHHNGDLPRLKKALNEAMDSGRSISPELQALETTACTQFQEAEACVHELLSTFSFTDPSDESPPNSPSSPVCLATRTDIQHAPESMLTPVSQNPVDLAVMRPTATHAHFPSDISDRPLSRIKRLRIIVKDTPQAEQGIFF
jgi:hypothetical protein